jgi:hypothetical protein
VGTSLGRNIVEKLLAPDWASTFSRAQKSNHIPEILEGGTNDELPIFEAPFQGRVRNVEKWFENRHFIACSAFQVLRLVEI